jgi:hypothetical protein
VYEIAHKDPLTGRKETKETRRLRACGFRLISWKQSRRIERRKIPLRRRSEAIHALLREAVVWRDLLHNGD